MSRKSNVKIYVLGVFLFVAVSGVAQNTVPEPEKKMVPDASEPWNPQPKAVTPGKYPCDKPIPAPSDALVLFDGTDLSQWENTNGGEAKWTIEGDILTVSRKEGNIRTKKLFRDFQLHIEWKIPADVQDGTHSQHRGNSGIFLQGKYEIQILDSYRHATYINGHAGSLYKKAPPLVNAMHPPEEWNVFDIIYTAPTFTQTGKYRTNPTVTVIHNGVVIQNHTIIIGRGADTATPAVGVHDDGPIILQAHSDRTTSEISFRNIWIREL